MAEQMKKRCLYDVLSVSRDCSQEEIRSAYRRLALQLHPDKFDQPGAASDGDATAAFQELLNAYEVFSDPKERTWYDSHRSQILFSDPSSSSKSLCPFDLDLFPFFSMSVYSGYADSGKGFFKVYGDVFCKIFALEPKFARFPFRLVAPAPLIGNLDSPYSQVTAFYTYWLGYSTVMDFDWIHSYDFVGHSGRSRRIIAKEENKERKAAKREYNETVRRLAAFVKKRDKRVLDMQMKKNEEEEKRRAKVKERKKEEDGKERVMLYQEPDWVKNDQEESKLIWDDDEDDKRKKKGKGEEEMYCIVCDKKFKSDEQWKNHEQSKKHWEKVAELPSAFDDEDEASKDAGDNESSESDTDKLSEAFNVDLILQGVMLYIKVNNSNQLIGPPQVQEQKPKLTKKVHKQELI